MSDEPTVRQLEQALALHESGRLDEAEAAYRAVLERAPDSHDAMHLLGLLLDQRDRTADALALIARAIAMAPHVGVLHLNHGNVLRRAGRPDQATGAWRLAARLAPELAPDAYANVAALAAETNQAAESVARWRRAAETARAALDAAPPVPAAYACFADALADVGELALAERVARAACDLAPDDSRRLNDLGRLLVRAARPAEAARAFRAAAALDPADPAVLVNLAGALASFERDLSEAVAIAARAIELAPRFAGAHETMALLMREAGRAAESADAARRATELAPDSPRAHNSLGNALYDLGRIDDALASFRRALALDPSRSGTHSNLLMLMHYQRELTPWRLLDEHLAWARRHADPITDALPPRDFKNPRDPRRRLRVGYLSPDFRAHPVAFFFEPLLRHHDRDAFEPVLYSCGRWPDEVTRRLADLAGEDGWRDVRGLGDDDAAALVRDDRIDILVDLAGHTAENRLLVLARRPAPVQATYVGYWNTTGMRAVDCRLTDAHNDPPGMTEQWWVERLVRVDGGAWCFTPPTGRPDVNDSPAARSGAVTFLSANRLAKVSDEMLALWRRILERSPRARLLVVTGGDEARVRGAFDGVHESRVELIGRAPLEDYFRLYHRADVLLDVLPHNGHTTSVDALWMGVPVVTLAGRTHCARLGASLLAAAGLERFVTSSPDEYVALAASLSERVDELARLRATLRDRLLGSRLTDGAGYARSVERALRQVWSSWCEAG
jgi:predicted O-linked N-acetylglucosamine transferase (SPINDLY family)